SEQRGSHTGQWDRWSGHSLECRENGRGEGCSFYPLSGREVTARLSWFDRWC
ncbi:hypothetical protein MHYP_G00269250, partial [Metynnis hypsauchen]